ncbi:MAG: 3-isopropylmalate dehydratase large subunit [Clostridiales bacterium 38_11]|nr:MAG: 3-isopropylmalate dehydratase large subunit [Clostridiales bacterium 38_11]HBH12931.1 3-isopropylmalate dehydratase large subunit [Clostridiales bacterium]
MGMTITEKILSRKTGMAMVKPWQIIEVPIDVAYIHDNNAPIAIQQFAKLTNAKVWNPEKVYFILDHHSPSTTFRAAIHHRNIREFSKQYGCRVIDVGRGVSHTVMAEMGIPRPGKIIVGTDSHTVGVGTFGCLATGIGSTEMAAVLATGKIWMRVPETVKVILDGQLSHGVCAKDVALLILKHFGPSMLNYMAIEFEGSFLDTITIEERMAINIMCLEMGVKNAIMPVDEKLLSKLNSTAMNEEIVTADQDAVYASRVQFDISILEPMVATPGMPTNGTDIKSVEGTKINQSTLGSCAGAYYHDLEQAAEILKGRKVNPDVRFVIVPNTSKVIEKAMQTGVAYTLIESGAVISSPSCGTCGGYEVGCLAPGEVCISTTTRNMDGRMGPGGRIYLASAYTVAASAVTGYITDPREFLGGGIHE